jgi:hypothetical protein
VTAPADGSATPLPNPGDPTQVTATMVAASGDQCPSCAAQMTADQRYCLSCGQRRGDPRLPFMDAVVFMDSVKQPATAATPPPPPPERRPRVSANASLIAGIATLVLAIGVGVLIGRSGDSGSAPVANTAPQVIKVEGGGGGSTEAAATGPKVPSIGGKGGAKKDKPATSSEAEKAGEEAQDEVLKTNPNVHLAPPTQEIGGKCDKETAGCSDSGKFEGDFFGE